MPTPTEKEKKAIYNITYNVYNFEKVLNIHTFMPPND
jgi:hypothetical protein